MQVRTRKQTAMGASIAAFVVAALAGCGGPQAARPAGEASAGGCPAAASEELGDTIELGSTMPLSGPLASVGQNQVGAQAYVDHINAQGGIGSRKVELTVLDDKGDPATAVANVQKLISEDEVDALVAVTTTPVNLAVAALAAEHCVPNLFALTGDARFTAGQFKGMIPATDPYDTQMAAIVADIVAEAGKDAVVGVIRTENDSGAGLEQALRKAAESTGLTVLDTQKVGPTETTPPTTQVQAIAEKAAVVVLLTSPFQCPPALQAIARAGWEPRVYSSDFCAYPSVLTPAGDLADGVRSVNWIVDPTEPGNAGRDDVRTYLSAIQAKAAPAAVTSFAQTGWVSTAGAIALLEKVSTAGPLTRANVMDAVEKVADLQVPLLYDGIGVDTAPGAVSPWGSVNVVEYNDGHYRSVRQVPAK